MYGHTVPIGFACAPTTIGDKIGVLYPVAPSAKCIPKNAAGIVFTVIAAPMLRVNVFVAVWGDVAESWACTVKEYGPDTVGVPAMVPADVPSTSPGGSEPETMFQLYGGVPPVATSVAL